MLLFFQLAGLIVPFVLLALWLVAKGFDEAIEHRHCP
jgi:hypothetical protein